MKRRSKFIDAEGLIGRQRPLSKQLEDRVIDTLAQGSGLNEWRDRLLIHASNISRIALRYALDDFAHYD